MAMLHTPDDSSPRSLSRRWIAVITIAASVLFLGAVGLAAVVAVSLASAVGTPRQPLLPGEPGPSEARDPVACPDVCFGPDDVGATIAGESGLARLGLTDDTATWGTHDPVTAGELYATALADWERFDGAPESCFFTPFNSPVGSSAESDESSSDDPVHFTRTSVDPAQRSLLDQSVRIFDDSASASAHLDRLAANIADCESVAFGPADDRYAAEVSPAPAFDVPDRVAAAGWARTGVPGLRWRVYVVDLQLANLVVRLRLFTDGAIREEDFRDFVEGTAVTLGGLEPATTADDRPETPASPNAVAPLECSSYCIDRVWAGITRPSSAEYDALGLTVHDESNLPATTAADALTSAHADWVAHEGSPESCFWSYPLAPIAPGSSVESDAGGQSIVFASARSDPPGATVLTQADREFASSALAVAHMRAQFDAVAQCAGAIRLDLGDGVESGEASQPLSLMTPDDVAAFGWRVDLPSRDVLIFEIQRGNLVTRIALVSSGTVSEARFRELAESVAVRVSRMLVVAPPG